MATGYGTKRAAMSKQSKTTEISFLRVMRLKVSVD